MPDPDPASPAYINAWRSHATAWDDAHFERPHFSGSNSKLLYLTDII